MHGGTPLEEGLLERTSEYAEEGRLAHAIAELKVLKKSTVMTSRTHNSRLKKLQKDPSYNPEMDKTTDTYLEYITELVMGYDSTPTVAVEVQVDFSAYVPEGFGTCDCCIIGGDTLSIVDYCSFSSTASSSTCSQIFLAASTDIALLRSSP